MIFPKGASDRPAILKCCLPNGMPIIVMHSSNPKMIWQPHAHRPPNISHSMFSGMYMHPLGYCASRTSEPKGQRHSNPILNVCIAIGMPIIVHANARLPVKYPTAASRPPNIHHSMFPIILMISMCL